MTKKLFLGFSTICILLEVLLISYSSYLDFIDLQILTSNSLISDKSVSLFFKKDRVPPVYDLINRYHDVTILSELYNNSDLRVWGICGNCYLDSKTSSLISGTFFKKDDFFKKAFKAVVGKNVLNSNNTFEDKYGKKYFKFNNNYYEIIGSICSNISNMLDNTVFVNLDSFNIKFHKLIIDSANSRSIATAVNSIKREYDTDMIRENNNFIERYIFNDVDKNALNILFIIFVCILVILLAMFTLHHYSEEIKVERIIGISFSRILFNLLKDIIFMMVVNTAFVFVIYTIVYCIFFQNIHLSFYLLSLIIFSFITLTAICITIYLYMIISNNLLYKNGVK